LRYFGLPKSIIAPSRRLLTPLERGALQYDGFTVTSVRQKILYFGCYEPLAETRRLLLEQLGFDTKCSMNPGDAPRIVREEKISLIVICNSCDESLCQKLYGALLLCSMSVPILRLDEDFPEAWRDPELLASLIRASLRGGSVALRSKPPQAEHGARLRRRA
jgi:hypothetical protein